MHRLEDTTTCPCCTPVADPESSPCTTGIGGKFMEPVLLLLLARGQAHGYGLLGQLSDFKISADTSALYRTLRILEEREFLRSEWDTDRTGPARRCYSLSNKGKEYLKSWVPTVREDRQRLDRFLTAYHEGIWQGRFISSFTGEPEKELQDV